MYCDAIENLSGLRMETYISIRALSRYVECMLMLSNAPPSPSHVTDVQNVSLHYISECFLSPPPILTK